MSEDYYNTTALLQTLIRKAQNDLNCVEYNAKLDKKRLR